MEFSVQILGCGSALPTVNRNPSAQLIKHRNKLFLVDCGEGTQLQLRRYKIKIQGIGHIFISHLHGDHYFGLVGLISTMQMLGRKEELHIYSPEGLEAIIAIQLDIKKFTFPLSFHVVEKEGQLLYEDRKMLIESIPLLHRIKCFGFIFKEKQKERKLIAEKLEEYNVPFHYRNRIKAGEDFINEKGEKIQKELLSTEGEESKMYAYCSDTRFLPTLIPYVKGVDLLYHEATFQEDQKERASKTFHSTAKQAATIAQEAGASKLLMGHFSTRYSSDEGFLKEAREVFANSQIAEEGKIYSL